MRRCPSTSAPLLLGCLLREKELVIDSVAPTAVCPVTLMVSLVDAEVNVPPTGMALL